MLTISNDRVFHPEHYYDKKSNLTKCQLQPCYSQVTIGSAAAENTSVNT